MIDSIRTDDNRGQVGIGTLIIFIALVLVAAVAAGVLIDTSGQLESRASDTGADAQSEVSNQVEVVSATGVDKANTDGAVEQIKLVVKKSAGSDPIDLSDATVQYTSDSASATLSYASAGADASSFTTTQIESGPTEQLDTNDQRVTIVVDANAVEGSDLSEGSNVDLEIVDQSGASTVYGVNIPDVLTGDYVPV